MFSFGVGVLVFGPWVGLVMAVVAAGIRLAEVFVGEEVSVLGVAVVAIGWVSTRRPTGSLGDLRRAECVKDDDDDDDDAFDDDEAFDDDDDDAFDDDFLDENGFENRFLLLPLVRWLRFDSLATLVCEEGARSGRRVLDGDEGEVTGGEESCEWMASLGTEVVGGGGGNGRRLVSSSSSRTCKF